MNRSELFGSPDFWQPYCEDEEQAELVAKLFPEYYVQRDSDWSYLFEQELGQSSRELALAWASTHLVEACKALKSAGSGKSLKADDLPIHKGSKSKQQYADAIHRVAAEYVQRAAPLPTAARPRTTNGVPIQSGDRLWHRRSVLRLLEQNRDDADDTLRWGQALLPYEKGRNSNFCVVGMPRSGKTTLLRLLLQSLSKGWRFGRKRLVVYDEKLGAVSTVFKDESELAKEGLILNPFDKRCVAWDIASDASTPFQAIEIARTLIPDTGKENPFYVSGPRAILAAVMVCLTEKRGNAWNLLDLVHASSASNIDTVLASSAHGREVSKTYFGGTSPSSQDLIKTLSSILSPLEPVATAWARCRTSVSIRDWAVSGRGVLILGNLNAYALALRAVNRTLIEVLVETLLDRDRHQARERDTFLFLDEFQSLGYITNLPKLLRTGLGLGVTTALGVHDLGLLKETYGQHAEGVLSLCGHYALLKTNSQETARWASGLFGEHTLRVRKESVTSVTRNDSESEVQTSTTVSENDERRPLVPPDEFLKLPLSSKLTGLSGYMKSPCHPSYRCQLEGDDLYGDIREPGSVHWIPTRYNLEQSDLSDFEPIQAEEVSEPYDFKLDLPKNEDIGRDLNAVLKCTVDGKECESTLREVIDKASSVGCDIVEYPVGINPPQFRSVTSATIGAERQNRESQQSSRPVKAFQLKDSSPRDILRLRRVEIP